MRKSVDVFFAPELFELDLSKKALFVRFTQIYLRKKVYQRQKIIIFGVFFVFSAFLAMLSIIQFFILIPKIERNLNLELFT